MLRTLHVRNFGVLGDVEVDFPQGLVVLTGETGAGKSLLVGAIKLLLGARADASDVRTGESMALVEAEFACETSSAAAAAISAAGYPESDSGPGIVHVKRTVAADGRSKAYINGSMASARELRDIIGLLVSVAGQHAFIGLGIAGERLAMLDAYAGVAAERERCEKSFVEWDESRRRYERLAAASGEREARRDYLSHVLSQIESVAPTVGEIERLTAEVSVLRGAGRLKELAAGSAEMLYEGGAAVYDALSRVEIAFREMSGIDRELQPVVDRLDSVRIEVRELAREITTYGETVDLDPERLAAVESRIEAIRDLMRKYGGSEQAVLKTLESCRTELAEIGADAGDREGLESRVAELKNAFDADAAVLSARRADAATELGRAVTAAVRNLAMEGATLEVRISDAPPSLTGTDAVEFFVETNPGEGFGAVSEVASGGELSRITLGLYSVMSASVGAPVMVYDEIDSGVSGGVAGQMGQVLKKAAEGRQVLVVTHHGQVAACGDAHFKVFKQVVNGRTVAGVESLDDRGRVDEIARIIGGVVITDKAREHAGEMLGARDDGLLL